MFRMPETASCYFCDYLAGDRPGLVRESARCVVLVNPREHQQGQLLIIPRRHVATILELDEQEATELMTEARRAGQALTAALAIDGLLLYQNNGAASGQEVPHVHLHVVPQREESSRFGQRPPQVADAMGEAFQPHEPTWLDGEQMERVAERIRAHYP